MKQATDNPRIETSTGDGCTELRLLGRFSLDRTPGLLARCEREIGHDAGDVRVLLDQVVSIDGGAVALLVGMRDRLRESGHGVTFVGSPRGTAEMLELIGGTPPRASLQAPPGGSSALEQIGRVVHDLGVGFRNSLGFLGELTLSIGRLVRNPSTMPWGELPRLAERTGADGLPIVVAINFLVGTTIALQGAIQLRHYGLDVYVADSVALATARSLGPLMTAIIVAGRSGAGFAAELGTMKVSEEIDALSTMGLDPMRYLVLPRIIALVAVMPMLTLLADLAAVLGGLTIGVIQLELTVSAYLERTIAAIDLSDLLSGLLKSVFFGLAIAYLACQRGLATEGGAEGVGKSTTSTVVSVIFALVVLEAIFASLFDIWGI